MKVNFGLGLRDIAGGKTVEFDLENGVTAQAFGCCLRKISSHEKRDT